MKQKEKPRRQVVSKQIARPLNNQAKLTEDTTPTSENESNSTTSTKFCAWCTETGRRFAHNTPDCFFLKTANAQDRWRIIGKQRTCPLCLTDKHKVTECPQRTSDARSEFCEHCEYTHCDAMGCYPQDQVSTEITCPSNNHHTSDGGRRRL